MAFSSVIVFIVNVQYLAVLDPERQAPVASDGQAPDHGIRRQAFRAVLQVEPFQPLWTKFVILTDDTVARRLTPVNRIPILPACVTLPCHDPAILLDKPDRNTT